MSKFGWCLMVGLVACAGDKEDEDDDEVGASAGCAAMCTDLADTYGLLTTGGEPDTELPGWSTGEYSETEYLTFCDGAPSTDSCDSCTEWYYEQFLEAARISGSCNIHYGHDGQSWDTGELAYATDECAMICAGSGLDF